MLFDIEKRSITNVLWKLQEADQREVLTLIQKFELPETLARTLVTRGVNIENAGNFLYPLIRLLLPDPFHLLDMDKAVYRIIQAINDDENIAIFGDYDVDGATSSALINRYLRMIGVYSITYIPDRINEGYGLNSDALLQLKNEGINLCISVDCGTLAYQPIKDAKNFGLDIIVIDHHLSVEKLPSAVAVVNPNRLDESSPYSDLAAVGVSFLMVVALNKSLREQGFFTNRKEPNLFDLLDLVALGTVCDAMQITGLNRAFVSQGLKVMSTRKNVGLRILSDALGIIEKPSVSRLGFNIGPCINAGGRIGEASLGARLLSTNDEEEAHSIALKLINLNNTRKMMENEAFSEAITQVEKSTYSSRNFIIVSGNWHQGIIGIIASKLKEQFHLPAIVISLSNGIGKASCRSIPEVNIGAAILSAKYMNLIIEGGGHSMAAGFLIREDKINDLRHFFTKKLTNHINDKVLKADGIVTVKAINLSLWNQLQRLEPFGIGNPEPRFIIQGVKIKKPKIVGVDHIKCFIVDNDAMVRAIAFRSVNTHLGSAIIQGNVKAVLGKIFMSYWNGNEFIQFLIEDVLTIN
ncbi:single-stranded-DNA-specific exonuclease RecJ [Wolbachia endosymbiont of Dirofilaria (Dirofilaria) immitis]|uniref:single-stranded-DNA-specific exonuclease RecJ n=1 Tax=Wolbachia endosymbiont of Dirofilaria (Dirofilaria) immitis TaxID=1812115 RepID=UPI00158D55CD|nr:single-stranded-DNA-specific exonuclease RecJ [Wolbachia endosymbiont of Dirofilaria (Dirofilaria) immitis]QKX02081.1 single-stranded-DNA-specific exonuclease RecJ [Wolbachia endosymbiont of Dirofilaria (Dirofilaria) immitis]